MEDYRPPALKILDHQNYLSRLGNVNRWKLKHINKTIYPLAELIIS